MNAKVLKPKTIEDYINLAPIVIRDRLVKLHAGIKLAAPGSSEGIKWRMPAYSYSKILVTFAVFKNHIGFYPMPSAIKAFRKELVKYSTAKGSIQFPHDKPLPLSLIKKIVKFRVKENRDGIIKWRS